MRMLGLALALLSPVIVGAQSPDAGAAGAIVKGPQGMRADSAARAAEARGFSGVMLLSTAGGTALEKGYGLANRADGVLFTPQTVVQIGSNTKDFTAVAVLQLHERGLLNLNDSLAKYFPDAPGDKREITIRQVLEHRAGLPDFVGATDFEPVGREEFLARLWKAPLLSPPGTKWAYSNAGYSLLAALIERLSKTSYDSYVQDNILEPVGMHNRGFALANFDQRRLAHGYRGDTDIGTILGHAHPADGPYWNLRGNGGMSSTVGEMHAFYDSLFKSSRLLRPETRQLHFDPDQPLALAGSDGVSFFLYERFPRLGAELIIASNSSRYAAPRLRREVAAAVGLPGDDMPNSTRPSGPAKQPSAEVSALVREFIRVMNSKDTSRVRRFIERKFASDASSPSLDERVMRFMQVAKNQGEFTILGLNETGPGSIDVAAHSALQGQLVLKVQIAPGSPPKIRGIAILMSD